MRTIVFMEGGRRVGTIVWDGSEMSFDLPQPLLKDLEDGVQDSDEVFYPDDGEDFLDAVLQEFSSGYLQAEEG